MEDQLVLLDLRLVRLVYSSAESMSPFVAHLERPEGIPLWRLSNGVSGSGSRAEWDRMVFRLAELKAEALAGGSEPTPDGHATSVTLELFDGRAFAFKIAAEAGDHERRQQAVQAISTYQRFCEAKAAQGQRLS